MYLMLLLLLTSGSMSVIPRADLERTVEQYIRSRDARHEEDLVIEFRSVPSGLVTKGKAYTLRVSEAGAMSPSGNVSVGVEVIEGGRVENHCIVSVRVRIFDTVFVAARQLGRHERIASQDIRRERMETTGLKGDALKSFAGLRTKRIVNAGSVLTRELTESVPDIAQGSAVTLIVRGKNFTFSVEAVAREDGARGELVTVQRAGNSARFQATVLDARTVEMTIQ